MSRLVSIRGGYKKPIKFLSVREGDMTRQDIDKILAYAASYLDMGVEVRDYHSTNLDTSYNNASIVVAGMGLFHTLDEILDL
tara:strand:+ start:345 stop:590 length:246 start_codon:yes stop_codon:yes gene_type:complete